MFWSKKIFGYKIWGSRNFSPWNFFGPKKLGPKTFSDLKILGFKRIKAPKKLSGQNWVSDSCDIPDMDKWHQDKWYLDQYHRDSWHLSKEHTFKIWSKLG